MQYILVASILLLIGVDQITKLMATSSLAGHNMIPVIGDVFYFTYTENTGAAFGMLKESRWIFIVLTFILVIAALYVLFKKSIKKTMLLKWALVPIIAGGLGNLIDRVCKGYVVDMIYFKPIDFPVFNFADICVNVGGGLLILGLLLAPAEIFSLKKKKKAPALADTSSSAAAGDGEDGD